MPSDPLFIGIFLPTAPKQQAQQKPPRDPGCRSFLAFFLEANDYANFAARRVVV
jgi:hypothetical protein